MLEALNSYLITSRIAISENGWTNDKICAHWFIDNFIPQAKAHADPNKPVVLMFNGHRSHLTSGMLDAVVENQIILFCLPPHTTHHFQPCDMM
jgi:hypothetical protein